MTDSTENPLTEEEIQAAASQIVSGAEALLTDQTPAPAKAAAKSRFSVSAFAGRPTKPVVQPYVDNEPPRVSRPTNGPVKVRIPLVVQGDLTDYGYTLKAIARHNDKHGDAAPIRNFWLQKETALIYQRLQVTLTGLYRAGLIEFLGKEQDRAIALTEKGRDFADDVFDTLPEDNSSVVATILRPTHETTTRINKALEEDPEDTPSSLAYKAGVNYGMAMSTMVYLDKNVKVIR